MSEKTPKAQKTRHPIVRAGIRLARIAVLLYVGLVVFAFSCERSMVYFPSRYPQGDWTLPGTAREVVFMSSDGETLVGWWFAADEPRATILFSHGNGGDITIRAGFAEELQRAGFSILLYDYRGYGKSTGSPSEDGLYTDARAAYDYVVGDLGSKPEEVILFGESLGSAVSVDLARHRDASGMVLLSPFTRFGEMAWKAVPLPIGWALRSEYDSIGKLGKLDIPLVVIHGNEDTLVPIEMGKRLYDSYSGQKSFVTVDGAGHNDILDIGELEIIDALSGLRARN